MLNPEIIIQAKQMVNTHQEIQEFNKQIRELLDKGLISNSKSSHTGPAFMVLNHAQEKRKKARMVINYKKLIDDIVFHGYYTPNKTIVFSRIRGASSFLLRSSRK